MVTIDTSTFIAFFAGSAGNDVELMSQFLEEELIILTPPVVSEILSDPDLPKKHENLIYDLPRIEIKEGFWERVGYLRKSLLSKKYKARLADCMIAQCCLDHKLMLVTRDSDFKAIAKLSGLKINL